MRLALRGNGLVERLALRVGLVPVPAAEVWAGMALSGVLVAAAALGVTERLAQGGAGAAELAGELGVNEPALEMLLECLLAQGHLVRRRGTYHLSTASRRWLDPRSDLSLHRFIASNVDYWSWWADLPDVIRRGRPVAHHETAPDDPYWRRYITGQLELARLGAGEVAHRLRVPARARRLLDVGGGHGWFAAQVCRRHPRLVATVLDLPGSARVGRDIVAAAGMSDRVGYLEGDARTADLGSGYDVVLCFNLVHHLSPAEIVGLFTRIRSALVPGGSIAVMDAFAGPGRTPAPAASFLGLFMYLGSGAATYTTVQLHDWLLAAGFARPRRVPMRRIPGQALYQATARRD